MTSIATIVPWRVPLPAMGIDLRLASGERWTHGLTLRRPLALRRALTDAGAMAAIDGRVAHAIADRDESRGRAWRARFDHPLVKFVAFPLLPALVAFRLHQVVAFGGVFGEYLTYGPIAWFTGLLLWWASWSMGLMLFAAALRVVIEVLATFVQYARREWLLEARHGLEWIARIAFYLGVPVWLAMRLVSGT